MRPQPRGHVGRHTGSDDTAVARQGRRFVGQAAGQGVQQVGQVGQGVEVEGGDRDRPPALLLRLDPFPAAEIERFRRFVFVFVAVDLPAPVVSLRGEGRGRVGEQGQRERGTLECPLLFLSLVGFFLFPLIELLPLRRAGVVVAVVLVPRAVVLRLFFFLFPGGGVGRG